MGLPTTYTQAHGQLKDFFGKIRDAQAPPKFVNQQLIDFGYKSTNHRAFIPLLKALNFLSSDGVPTQRYHDYRNHALSKQVMAQALREAYSDIFLIKSTPTAADKTLIEGKFKSFHNASDIVASLMTKTFYALLELADLTATQSTTSSLSDVAQPNEFKVTDYTGSSNVKHQDGFGLHYNIQIHLPATKDLEVYNAIFKSLKDHLLE